MKKARTENEAIEVIKKMKLCDERIIEGCSSNCSGCDLAIKDENIISVYDMAISALKEIQQYRFVGTVSECREAVEKQKPKTPNIWGDGYNDEGKLIYDMYDCPNCSKSYEIDYEKHDYCHECGQAIDWGRKKQPDTSKREVQKMSKVHVVVEGNYALSRRMNAFSTRELAEGFRDHIRKETIEGDVINIFDMEIDEAVLKDEDM